MNKNITTDGCFRTLTGLKFSLIDPSPEMISIQDISAGLANKGHFSGLTPRYFSIAEHCLLTDDLCAFDVTESDYELRLIALLHDASEAYVGDIIRPLKDLVPEFRNIENKIHEAIFKHFNLPIERLHEIKKFDITAQDLEANVFYRGEIHQGVRYLSPYLVRQEFESRLMFLIKKREEQIIESRIIYDPLIPEILKFIERDKLNVLTVGMIMREFSIGLIRSPKILLQMVRLGYLQMTNYATTFNVINNHVQ